MTMTNAQMVIWLTEWARVWNLPALPESVRVEFSPRIRRSLGRCHSRKGIIRLNPALLSVGPDGKDDHEALLREVLCHEAAHVAAYLLHGAVRPHGPEWGGLMRAAGYSSRARMDPSTLPAEFRRAIEPTVVYLHRCPVCGASRKARRPVRRWRCKACHTAGLAGRLEILTRRSLT